MVSNYYASGEKREKKLNQGHFQFVATQQKTMRRSARRLQSFFVGNTGHSKETEMQGEIQAILDLIS